MICFFVQFCYNSLLVLKMHFQVVSFTSKKVQGFSNGTGKISVICCLRYWALSWDDCSKPIMLLCNNELQVLEICNLEKTQSNFEAKSSIFLMDHLFFQTSYQSIWVLLSVCLWIVRLIYFLWKPWLKIAKFFSVKNRIYAKWW